MWKSIKKFFKWIANYTGISWIAKKVSSGWNWLFSSKANTAQENTSPERPLGENVNKSNTVPTVSTLSKLMQNETEESVSKTDINVEPSENFPEKSEQPRRHVNPNKPNVIQQNTKPGSYFEFTDNKLLFVITNENYTSLEAKCKNEDENGKVIPGEFLIFVECGSDKFCITGPYSSWQDVGNGKKSVSVTSVRKQNNKGPISKDPLEMMYKVGSDENTKLVEITRMSRKPFEITTPNLNATKIQQTVINGSEITITDQQRALDKEELVANKPKEVGELKFDGEKLLLVTTSDQFAKCKDYRNTQSTNPDELLMFIKCSANEYRIAGNINERSILIKSILRKSKGDKYIDGNILRVEEEILSVKKMLGLKNSVTEVKVDSILNKSFEAETPNLNATKAQQMVNNEEVTTESEKFYDIVDTQPSPIIEVPEAQRHFISNPSKVGNGYY